MVLIDRIKNKHFHCREMSKTVNKEKLVFFSISKAGTK